MPTMPLDPVCCELLRAVVRSPAKGDRGSIARLIEGVQDWDAAITGAHAHGVLPMLYARLSEEGLPVPAAALERMRAGNDRNVFHSLANAAELLDVLKAFDEQQIPAMPFKGVVLAASVYKDLSARPAGDLDVLVFFKDLKRAEDILTRRGYELETPVKDDGSPVNPDYFECYFERQSDGMVIELRWRLELTEPRFRRNLGMDWVWPRRQVTTLAGARVPDLDPETALLVLCMHGSKHAWSRLIWTCDVARLLERHPDLEWGGVIREAKRTGLLRALALGVLLAHRVAAAPVPQTVLRSLEAVGAVRDLAQHFDENLLKRPGLFPRGRVPYNIHLLGIGDRIRMLFSLSVLQPNAWDREFVRLPRALDPLYYVIRPFRILLDRSGR
jgi:Uncharacterised nucleotidyltransferase